ncbi:hypothetical protein [Enterococcus gallinarum]|uniref:hypothetical protein n=1 Tax=Enterococcus gallinarum TaxID=1353 RepID=UPI0010744F34|nr:hypothetical protein [Enterococcus gallinarum]MBF0825567.1 hypothetical protein [Enterococcus faecalis]MBX8989949.1 hypothetical protein [Escherichia coli]MBF0726227.1 hypothetical protein [Enterococcus gallinarum]MBF0799130.1 hypothetical protein [Enterococcus gallinarum]NYS82328.1 hypothetical protein [Enterococcus gallinarum]
MGVNKFYAIYLHEDGSQEIVDAYQAIHLVYKEAVIVTKPKEKCPLYDIETNLKVSPVRRKNPYFKYYSDEESPLKGRSSILEFTPELKLFIRAFEEIKSFKIEEWENDPITIQVETMKKLQRVEIGESFVILKFLVTISETWPYSYYYKFNGMLGLEFSVTSQPEPIKIKGLEKQGISLFHSNIQFPAWLSVPPEFSSKEQFERIAREIRNTYQNRNYRLQGEIKNEAIIFPEYKEKYEVLSKFEQQCAFLEKEIQKLKLEKANEQANLQKLENVVANELEKLKAYRQENERYTRLDEDNQHLTSENNDLKEKLGSSNAKVRDLHQELQESEKKRTRLKEKIEEVEKTNTKKKRKLLDIFSRKK